jgi:hypothetical protein
MRIRIIRKPTRDQADGIDLRRFVPGRKYEVGSRIGALMLAEGWAEPLADDEPALLPPVSGTRDSSPTSNLAKKVQPRSVDDAVGVAADFKRRRRPRSRRN